MIFYFTRSYIYLEMANQDCSKNIVLMNDANWTASNHLLIDYEHKIVELKIMRNMISLYHNSFSEKKKILEEEKQKLDKLHYQTWSLKDSFCNQVWRFSYEHDFSVIFKYYPCTMKIGHNTKWKNVYKDDTEDSSTLIDLINEIDFIKEEIYSFNNGKDLKRNTETALMNLEKLQIIADDAMELLRLINPLQSSCIFAMPIYNEVSPINPSDKGLKNKKQNKTSLRHKHKLSLKNDKLNGTSNKKEVTSSSKNYPQLILEKSIIFNAKSGITNFTSSHRFENFTLKKRSEISIKFEQRREHK